MRWRPLLLVAGGGVLGSEARYLVTSAWHGVGAVWAVNVLGGLLIGLLMGRGPAEGARLFLGVGVLGGFTTFSTYALDGHDLLAAHDWVAAAAYLVGTPVVVLVATFLGVRLAVGRVGAVSCRPAGPGPDDELDEVRE